MTARAAASLMAAGRPVDGAGGLSEPFLCVTAGEAPPVDRSDDECGAAGRPSGEAVRSLGGARHGDRSVCNETGSV